MRVDIGVMSAVALLAVIVAGVCWWALAAPN
jgi:hypothetical protein